MLVVRSRPGGENLEAAMEQFLHVNGAGYAPAHLDSNGKWCKYRFRDLALYVLGNLLWQGANIRNKPKY